MLGDVNGETRLFPIIGDPICHVKSPQKFSRGLAQRGCNGICIALEVPENALDKVMQGLAVTPNVDGILITMPHKFAALDYCATRSDRARLLGCVSVMRRNPDGTWHGDMLDGLAFVRAMKEHGARLEGARALLIGAGGAGSAIAIALLQAGVRELGIWDIDQGRTSALGEVLAGIDARHFNAGSPDPVGFDLVCNATPLGWNATDPLPVPVDTLKSNMFVGDVVAGSGDSPLMVAARAAGCKTSNGEQMVEAVQDMMLDFMLHDEGR